MATLKLETSRNRALTMDIYHSTEIKILLLIKLQHVIPFPLTIARRKHLWKVVCSLKLVLFCTPVELF